VPPPSLLSLQLRPEYRATEGVASPKISAVSSNNKGITVYAPDTSPIEVNVDGSDTVSNVIRKVIDSSIYWGNI
jgi:ribose 5-phosphate isomerase